MIEDFILTFSNESKSIIKRFRSDNGTEFINSKFKNICKNRGIIHETTVPYTPEQNGRAEREMRTIVEVARTMLQAKSLGKEFWA